MHSLNAYDTPHITEQYPPSDDNPRVNTAYKAEFDTAILGITLTNDANLIHMCCQHHDFIHLFSAFTEHHQIADIVLPDFIRIWLRLCTDILPYCIFTSGRARQTAQLFQKLCHFRATSP